MLPHLKTTTVRDLDGPDAVFVHWVPTVEGWGVTSTPRQGSPPCGGKMGLPPLFGGDSKLGRRWPGLSPVAATFFARDASFELNTAR